MVVLKFGCKLESSQGALKILMAKGRGGAHPRPMLSKSLGMWDPCMNGFLNSPGGSSGQQSFQSRCVRALRAAPRLSSLDPAALTQSLLETKNLFQS